MEIYHSVQILCSGMVAGFILFQSAIVAPTVFTVVSEDNRGPLLRRVFPKLFKSVAAMGLFILLLSFVRQPDSWSSYAVGGFTLVSSMLCDGLIPATNQARDSGEDKRFAQLHRLSVLLTLSVLFVNLLWIFIDA
ncbi:MAG: hypothetical protein CMK59_07235 [Proteobacteria bacterium]|nr:hypothetical protein [Pseudomonadota bacterium]